MGDSRVIPLSPAIYKKKEHLHFTCLSFYLFLLFIHIQSINQPVYYK
jgi:hypothetical protein